MKHHVNIMFRISISFRLTSLIRTLDVLWGVAYGSWVMGFWVWVFGMLCYVQVCSGCVQVQYVQLGIEYQETLQTLQTTHNIHHTTQCHIYHTIPHNTAQYRTIPPNTQYASRTKTTTQTRTTQAHNTGTQPHNTVTQPHSTKAHNSHNAGAC